MEWVDNEIVRSLIEFPILFVIMWSAYPTAMYLINHMIFSKPKLSKLGEILLYGTFPLVAYLHAAGPFPEGIAFNIIRNIPLFLIYPQFYVGSREKKIAATLCIIMLLHFIDLLMILNTPIYAGINTYFPETEFFNSIVIMSITIYLIPLTLKPFKFLKEDENVPKIAWVTLILLSLNFYGIGLLIVFNHISTFVNSVLIICVATGWFTMMFMLDRFYATYERGIRDEIDAVEKAHFQEMHHVLNQNHEEVQKIRHDIKLHLNALLIHLEQNVCMARGYIEKLLEENNDLKILAHSNNVVFDAVINSTLGKLKKSGISVNVDLVVPPEAFINAVDATTLLGNMLQNALTATEKMDTGFIDVKVKYEKSMLSIVVENSYDGVVKYVGGVITSKKKKGGGLGLKQVEKIVKKYDGTLESSHDLVTFRVVVCLFL